jgi:hypothetical protein
VNTAPDMWAVVMVVAAITGAVVITEEQFDPEMTFELQLRDDHGPKPSVTPQL